MADNVYVQLATQFNQDSQPNASVSPFAFSPVTLNATSTPAAVVEGRPKLTTATYTFNMPAAGYYLFVGQNEGADAWVRMTWRTEEVGSASGASATIDIAPGCPFAIPTYVAATGSGALTVTVAMRSAARITPTPTDTTCAFTFKAYQLNTAIVINDGAT